MYVYTVLKFAWVNNSDLNTNNKREIRAIVRNILHKQNKKRHAYNSQPLITKMGLVALINFIWWYNTGSHLVVQLFILVRGHCLFVCIVYFLHCLEVQAVRAGGDILEFDKAHLQSKSEYILILGHITVSINSIFLFNSKLNQYFKEDFIRFTFFYFLKLLWIQNRCTYLWDPCDVIIQGYNV